MPEAFMPGSGWVSCEHLKIDDCILGIDGPVQVRSICPEQEAVHLHSRGIDIRLSLEVNVLTPDRIPKSVQDLTPDSAVLGSLLVDVPGADIPDELLTFMGWLLTDGAFDRGQFRVYQNIEKMEPVMQAVNACNFYKHSFGIDDRVVRGMKGQGILGRVTISTQHSGKVTDALQVTNKRIPPPWLFELSRSQLDKFITTLALGDGQMVDGKPRVLYGYTSLMDPLQTLLTLRGYRTKIAPDGKENSYLHLTETPRLTVSPKLTNESCWHVTASGPYLLRSGGGVIVVEDPAS